MTTTETKPSSEYDDPTEREALEWMQLILASSDPRDSDTKTANAKYKGLLRAFMEEHDDELFDPETGLRAKLGATPHPTSLDREVELSKEVIYNAYQQGFLVLNSALWKVRDATVAPTLQSAAFASAIRYEDGTRPLSVKARGS